MRLQAGARLGPYEIIELLGAGGMGEVYRARDTRLDRLVAIKVVSEAAAGGELALERFEREARAASALNHPNICTIYDVGAGSPQSAVGGRQSEVGSRQSEPIRYLVMELLDGETLQQRLTRGPLHVAAIVDIGLALADALDAAHGAGIIHRDIKPANIFLVARGAPPPRAEDRRLERRLSAADSSVSPKILDFGLAKTAQRATTVSGRATLAAEAMQTQPGSTVGTVAYMSPEQLRGETIDPRSDLFSLGLVLYEMAAGRPAFSGATSAVISGAILHNEPIAPRQLRAELPSRLEEVILKALEKDRDVRCQTASELRADLKRLKRESDSRPVLDPTVAIPALVDSPLPPARSSSAPSAGRRASTMSPPAPASDADLVAAAVFKKFRNGLIVVVGGAVAAVALAFVMADRWYAFRAKPDATPPAGPSTPGPQSTPAPRNDGTLRAQGTPPAAPPVRPPAAPAAPSPAPVATAARSAGTASAPPVAPSTPTAVSPPLIAGDVRPRDLQIVPLTTSGRARRPSISGDGSLVAFIEQDDVNSSVWIRRVSTPGSTELVPAQPGIFLVGATITPDGAFVDFVRRQGGRLDVWRVPSGGGTPQKIIDRVDSLIGWSPDGQQMAFVRVLDRQAAGTVLVLADRNGGNERVIVARRAGATFGGLGVASRPGLRPAWSPDGRVVAVPGIDRRGGSGGGSLERRGGAGGSGADRRGKQLDPGADRRGALSGRGGQTPQIVLVDVASGRERSVPTGLPVSDLAWLNRNTLVLDRAAEPGIPSQLWRLSEPGGQLSRLTNDANGYSDVSVTTDGTSLVTTRYERQGAVIATDVVLMRGLR